MRAFRFSLLAALALAVLPHSAVCATYYVRHTVGNDSNDGLSPQTAWRRVEKLSKALRAGDTAYVGPGLYRGEGIQVLNSGTAENRITLIADTTGLHTGDPPGIVMITGAEPVDEKIFVEIAPGTYRARFTDFLVAAVVEMDSPQFRYTRTEETREHVIDKLSQPDVVKKLRSHMYHDKATEDLYIHTSDDRPPTEHELELVRYGNGISTSGQHYVTVIGFTFRHVGDGGINFFKDSGDVIAINNVSYGSRQGIRVYGASNVLIYGNTFFRNENSGVYFALKSVNGVTIGNVSYENVKGLRWSSESGHAVAIDNKLFDNLEAGIAIENATPATLRGNVMVNNKAQILNVRTQGSSDSNCFENRSPGQLTARLWPYRSFDSLKNLADYQKATKQDLHSKEGGCGSLPQKLDVHRMHAETSGYRQRALKILEAAAASQPTPGPSPTVTPRR